MERVNCEASMTRALAIVSSLVPENAGTARILKLGIADLLANISYLLKEILRGMLVESSLSYLKNTCM